MRNVVRTYCVASHWHECGPVHRQAYRLTYFSFTLLFFFSSCVSFFEPLRVSGSVCRICGKLIPSPVRSPYRANQCEEHEKKRSINHMEVCAMTSHCILFTIAVVEEESSQPILRIATRTHTHTPLIWSENARTRFYEMFTNLRHHSVALFSFYSFSSPQCNCWHNATASLSPLWIISASEVMKWICKTHIRYRLIVESSIRQKHAGIKSKILCAFFERI